MPLPGMLRGGGAALMANGMGLGVNAGAGAIMPVGRTASLRVDYTFRRLLGDLTGVSLSALTIGVGFDY